MNIRDLTLKLVALLALTAASRVSEIHLLNTNWMGKAASQYVFYFKQPIKNSNQKKRIPSVTFYAYEEDKSLCVVETLASYLMRTRSWRVDEAQSQLLLSTLKPHAPVVKSTISGWMKTVLARAGIDVMHFKAHSTRAASTSKAALVGVSLVEIIKQGVWSNESTWQKFYNKGIVTNSGKNFSNAVLGKRFKQRK